MGNIGKNYLDVMQDITKKNAKTMTESLEEALYNAMTSLNVGMISFVPNGNNSNFDVPRAYATMEDNSTMSDEPYFVREIIAVIAKARHIYIVPDTDQVTSELIDELDSWTHFTRHDVAKLKDLEWCSERLTDNYNFLNTNDTMFRVFKSCNEALKTIEEPLERTINISEPEK